MAKTKSSVAKIKKYCEICKVDCFNLARHCATLKHQQQVKWNELCNKQDGWTSLNPVTNQNVTWFTRLFHFSFNLINVIIKFVTNFHC